MGDKWAGFNVGKKEPVECKKGDIGKEWNLENKWKD